MLDRRTFLAACLPLPVAGWSPRKVAAVETYPAGGNTFVRVLTADGIEGYGEAHAASGASGTPFAVRGAVEYCAEYLTGQDALAIETNWQHLYRRAVFRGGADAMAALGAVDMALWDIAGKAAGVPVYRLLGGPLRGRVRVFGRIGGASPAELAAAAKAKVEQGFPAVHFYPLGPFAGPLPEFSRLADQAAANVEAVRQAVGPHVELLVDVVCRLKPPEAIAIGRAIAPYRPFYFEDPVEPENVDAIAQVAAQSPVPIATGERLTTIYQFRDVLRKRAAAYLRPDLALAGGITNCRKIAALAEAEYVDLAPHNPLSPLLTAASAQFCAGVSNIAFQELGGIEEPSEIFPRPLTLREGFLEIPERPGLGLDVDLAALRRAKAGSYQRRPVLNQDGSLRDY